jgi:hypothetical protein
MTAVDQYHAQARWEEIVSQHLHGPLPFVEIDPDNGEAVVSRAAR